MTAVDTAEQDKSRPGPPDAPDGRIEVRRGRDRARYDRGSVHAVLDAGFVAHVGTIRGSSPLVIPMFYVRRGDSLLLHGAPATGTLRRGGPDEGGGIEVCVTVTHVDGLVLARSAFHHSVNYRSVVVLGEARPIDDEAERREVLDAMVDVLVEGRSADLRPMTDKEVRGTSVLEVPLASASVKIRSGGPVDDEEDYALPIWAGVVPLVETYGDPVPDDELIDGVEVPRNVTALAGRER